MTTCFVLLVLLLAAAVVLWDRLHLRRQIIRLDAMLEQATRGVFQEETFDESRLSALETRLAHYLCSLPSWTCPRRDGPAPPPWRPRAGSSRPSLRTW